MEENERTFFSVSSHCNLDNNFKPRYERMEKLRGCLHGVYSLLAHTESNNAHAHGKPELIGSKVGKTEMNGWIG